MVNMSRKGVMVSKKDKELVKSIYDELKEIMAGESDFSNYEFEKFRKGQIEFYLEGKIESESFFSQKDACEVPDRIGSVIFDDEKRKVGFKVAIDEVVTNALKYYGGEGEREARVRYTFFPVFVRAEVYDKNFQYDEESRKEAIDRFEERKAKGKDGLEAGGMGVYLSYKLSDWMFREGNKTVLFFNYKK